MTVGRVLAQTTAPPGGTVWDWGFALEILPELLRALVVTVQATVAASVLALSLGLALALLRRSDNVVIRLPVAGFIEFIRSTPLLVHLFFLFYALPRLGLTLGAFTAGVIGLGVHYATYTSEVYRAGIEGVAKGQWEAATAVNLSPRRTWTGVILPQAIPAVLPSLGNYIVAMFKETPLLFAITVIEVLGAARIIGTESFRYLEAFTLVGLLFFLVSYPSVLLLRRLEARLATK
ncbi:MAG: ectoine/hydroxyectoine ABC transporter permease subunit EhuD [Egibacteraceae bacterium]